LPSGAPERSPIAFDPASGAVPKLILSAVPRMCQLTVVRMTNITQIWGTEPDKVSSKPEEDVRNAPVPCLLFCDILEPY
jgi:hypothetical protein